MTSFFLGLLGSGRTFKKSFRKSQSILEEEEDSGGTSLKDDLLEAADLSRNRIEKEGESWTEMSRIRHGVIRYTT